MQVTRMPTTKEAMAIPITAPAEIPEEEIFAALEVDVSD